jgi:dTDP-4-amino-4,6-dideoxygalactose transaminase
LRLAYRGLDLSGEVVTTPITFATTVAGIEQAGATPVLADVDPETLTLDPESVANAIGPETAAIVPVHYAGGAAPMDAIRDLAATHDIPVIEDAAQALGGQFRGSALGSLGRVGCFSFHPTKQITTGEGGMLVTDDAGLAERVRRLRLAGVDKDAWSRKNVKRPSWHYDVMAVSGKSNMTDIQAALGLAQLDRLDELLRRRRTVAAALDEGLASVDGVRPLAVPEHVTHARAVYTVVLGDDAPDRMAVDRALDAEGIDTGVYYIPIHRHTAFGDIDRVQLATTDMLADRILSLPLHPGMDESDAADVVVAVRKVIRGLAG